jgi:hypothetical protein
LLNMMISNSIHFSCKWNDFVLPDCQIILHRVYIPYFLYSLINWWAHRLIL